jgi:hypothetical protein
LLGQVKNSDILAITALQEVEGDEDVKLKDSWDHILI